MRKDEYLNTSLSDIVLERGCKATNGVFMREKKAEMGVGTLIIFISLLLVAAVAAGVLIQTAGSLQQRALSTGQAAQAEISTSLSVLEVSGSDGANGSIDSLSLLVNLVSGSDPINLDQLMISLNTVQATGSYAYSNASSPVFVNGEGTFVVTHLQGINGSSLLRAGDLVRIDLLPPHDIGERSYVRIHLVPRVGAGTRIFFETPNVMSQQRVYLYP